MGRRMGYICRTLARTHCSCASRKMGLRSATAPDAIVADKTEVENLECYSTPSAGGDWDIQWGCRRGCAEGLCGSSVWKGLSSEVEELLRNRKVMWGEGVDVN
jgi:hypothetical protein